MATVIAGIGIGLAGYFGYIGATEAADTQADAISSASAISAESAAQAREDVLNIMAPALSDYAAGINQAIYELSTGEQDVFEILNATTSAANDYLTQAGIDATQAILGGSATAQLPNVQTGQDMFNVTGGGLAQVADPGNIVDRVTEASTASTANVSDVVDTSTALATTIKDFLSNFSDTGTSDQVTNDVYSTITDRLSELTAPGSTGDLYPDAATRSTKSLDNTTTNEANTVNLSNLAGATYYNPLNVELNAEPTSLVTVGSDYGFAGATEALASGEERGQQYLTNSVDQAIQAISAGLTGSLSTLDTTKQDVLSQNAPYTSTGTQATNLVAALSGALGADAQAQAYSDFVESPGQTYLTEQAEKALLRNAAATGDLGSSNILTALQENAVGMSSTYLQQAIDNLNTIANRGLTSTTNVSDILTQLGTTGAGFQATSASDVANLLQQLGISQTQLTQLTSQQQADLAYQTGLSISEIQQAMSLAQSTNISNYGSLLSAASSGASQDISNLLSNYSTNTLNAQQNIAQTLANIGIGAGTNAANLEAAQGSALATGQTAQTQAIQSTISDLSTLLASKLNSTNSGNTTISGAS